jgi:hypothetical protein
MRGRGKREKYSSGSEQQQEQRVACVGAATTEHASGRRSNGRDAGRGAERDGAGYGVATLEKAATSGPTMEAPARSHACNGGKRKCR